MQQQHLLLVEDDKGQREFLLDAVVYSLGSDPACDIQLHSMFLSRRHATLVQLLNDNDTSSYRIVDGNLRGKVSANGLLVNGCKLQAHDLQHEDEVVFGPQVRAIYYRLPQMPANDVFPPDFFPPGSSFPRKPIPISPSDGSETLPDHNVSQTP